MTPREPARLWSLVTDAALVALLVTLGLAASLVATHATDAPQALQRADALRPAWLAPRHPLDALRATLGQGGSSAPWAGQF